MRSHLTQYITGITILSIICLIAGYYLIHNVFNAPLGLIFYISVFLLFAISVGVQVILARSNQIKAQAFVRSYMLSSSAKLFLYLAFMMVYALTHKDRAVPFILAFFSLYAIYTVYDVMMSNRFFGKN